MLDGFETSGRKPEDKAVSDYSLSPDVDDPDNATRDIQSTDAMSGTDAGGETREPRSRLPEQVQGAIECNRQRIEATTRLLAEAELTASEGQAQLAERLRPKPFNYFAPKDPRPWFKRGQRTGIPRGL